MKRIKLFSLVIGLATILASGLALADDVVTLGVLPGSSIQVRDNAYPLGQDPPTSTFNNVSVADDGTVFGAQSDISFTPIDVNVSGFVVHIELRAQSDLMGTYDRNTGSFAAAADFDLKGTSNAPGFNNNTCISPTTTFNLSTDNLGGAVFSGGIGTVVDSTFIVNAIPLGRCGSHIIFGDYARLVNQFFGLPSPSGANTVSLILRMDPPLAP